MNTQSLRRYDPRTLALEYPGWYVAFFVVLCLTFGTYGNWRVLSLRGGIIDDALPSDNRYRLMHEYVQAKAGFSPQDLIPIIIKTPEFDAASVQTILTLSKNAQQQLSGGVLSLAALPNYVDTGEELLDVPYVTDQSAAAVTHNSWKKRVASDSAAYGILVDRHWQWASITRFLPEGYQETDEAWKTIEFLEGRTIPWWERLFFKTDIQPLNPAIGVSGWVMGRWQIDQGMNRDMLLLPSLGVVISFAILWFFLGSLRQTTIAVGVNIIAGIWLTRACIWPLNEAGTGIFERVYTVVAYANVIVQGISFSLHKLHTFREAPGQTSHEKFLKARGVDAEIGMVALIAVAAFLCMNTFPIWQMQEMAYQSAIGVLFVFVGATIFIPALYMWLERVLGPELSQKENRVSHTMNTSQSLEKFQISPLLAISIPVCTFLFACGLFLTGRIEAKTKPWDYIKDTLVERTFQFLKGSGNEFLDLLVEPREGDINRPDFIQAAWALQTDLTPRYGAPEASSRFEDWQDEQGFTPIYSFKEVGSVLGKVRQIAQESYHKEWPETAMEVEDAFFLIEDGIDPEVNQQMWFSGGLRFAAGAVIDDSIAFRQLIERTLLFAEQRYPRLTVSTFGKAPNYPQMDLYITQGEGPNILVSLLTVLIFYAIWAALRERNLRLANTCLFRPLVCAGMMLLPFLFGIGVIGILLWLAEVPLSMSTAPFADLAINASGDFGIYLVMAFMLGLSHSKDPKAAINYALLMEGLIVFTDFVLNVLAFLPLLASQFQPVRELGWLMVCMLLACAVGALVFVPSVLPLAVKDRAQKGHAQFKPEVIKYG